jgi:ABC-type glycerol-3-phosphate transport system substrate-binding protein
MVLCVLATLLCGCAGEETPLPTPESVTITFAFEGINMFDYVPLVAEFEKQYPHITVELQPWEWRPNSSGGYVGPDYSADVNVVFTGGMLPSMLNLTPFIETDGSLDRADFSDGAIQLFTADGAIWAIPTGVDVAVMYYNRDLFDQRSVTHPTAGWKTDEFLDRAIEMSDPEADLFGYGINRPSFPDAAYLVYSRGGQLVDDLANPTRPTFTDPKAVAAIKWYAGLMHEHNVAPTEEQAQAFGRNPLPGAPIGAVDVGIANSKVAMWMGRYSEKGGIRYYSGKEWDFDWGMVPLPSDGQRLLLADAEGLAISGDTENPEACWQWIVFLSKQMPSRLAPARQSLLASEEYRQDVGDEIASVARNALESGTTIYSGDTIVDFGPFGEAVDVILTGEITPEEALAQAQEEAIQLLE